MKRALIVALALASMVSADAAEQMPTHIAGVWSTAESLYAGTTGQTELYLLRDGTGAIGVSSPAKAATDGPDKGKLKPHVRVIGGFAFRARMEGEVLVLQPIVDPGEGGGRASPLRLTYWQTADGPILSSPGNAIPGEAMKRRSDTVPEQIAQMIAGYLAKLSAPRPAPSIRP
ncbi:hypothetical protein [Massilia sp. IC2-476]|uniref:hypothetical protein n=1 Tax=Massilia sp. IC2-476 TaxID=2887199 RepID=UPI001D12475E|nr:hypothetical protein [Massilia sp. IC2-476]MCC2971336.1 hypothetical protein [Massilia sp. IC2-476]